MAHNNRMRAGSCAILPTSWYCLRAAPEERGLFGDRSSDIAERSGAFSTGAMRLVAERMHAAGVDPAIVEVEERADSDGVPDGVVIPSGVVKTYDVRAPDV